MNAHKLVLHGSGYQLWAECLCGSDDPIRGREWVWMDEYQLVQGAARRALIRVAFDRHVAQADAERVAAAAPEMYEALTGWLPIAERLIGRVPNEARDSNAYAYAHERIEKSRRAVAKAEGRQQA